MADKNFQYPEFHGNVSEYRDWKRAIQVRHAGATDEQRALTAPRVLAALKGDAHHKTKHLDPEELRYSGQEGLRKLIQILDKSYQWQPESLLFESLEGYLHFPPRRGGESITGYLARYHTVLGQFVGIVNDYIEKEAREKYNEEQKKLRFQQIEWSSRQALEQEEGESLFSV